MSKTNLDNLDLTQPGIEADEINTESASAGAVLRADGAGGASFGRSSALLRLWHDTEDQFAANAWIDIVYGYVETDDDGFVYDDVTGEITIGPALAGCRLIINVKSGMWNASQDGNCRVQVSRKPAGGSYSSVESGQVAVVQSGDVTVAEVQIMVETAVGDMWAVKGYLSGAGAGTGEWVLDEGILEFLAV